MVRRGSVHRIWSGWNGGGRSCSRGFGGVKRVYRSQMCRLVRRVGGLVYGFCGYVWLVLSISGVE